MDNLRVLVVADDPLVRAGLATLLAGQPGCILVGQVAADSELPARVPIFQPEVILWDLGWEPGPSLDRLADLAGINIPLVVLLPDETYASQAWQAGARGLLNRDIPADRLQAALLGAARGLATLEPELLAALRAPFPVGAAALPEVLTPRELEVLALLAEGLSNKAIARRLGISEHTIKFHVNAILGKLGAQSRTEAVVQATRLGLLLL